MSKAWPVTLRHGEVRLRPLRVRDAKRWQQLRASNQDWLAQWEATSPMPTLEPPPTFRQSARQMLTEARAGRTMPFVVEYQGNFVGPMINHHVDKDEAKNHYGEEKGAEHCSG